MFSKMSQSVIDTSPHEKSASSQGVPKPKPPPKPRPWSIVGVDRKSGEFASVDASGPNHSGGSATERPEEGELAAAPNSRGRPSAKGSVRSFIANLQKPAADDGPASRSGNSLPRNSAPPHSSNNESSDVLGSNPSPGHKFQQQQQHAGGTISPKTFKKFSDSDTDHSKSNAEGHNTCDDPRILKLEDDFSYDDIVDV